MSIVLKNAKGGYVVAKFHATGFLKPNHPTFTIGANTAGEVVQEMNIVAVDLVVSNNVSYTISRGANTILTLADTCSLDLADGRILDSLGGNPSANVVVTKVGTGVTTLILKLHKRSAITGGSQY